eukprot:4645059-Pleurochrysis_carterae.AAC.2
MNRTGTGLGARCSLFSRSFLYADTANIIALSSLLALRMLCPKKPSLESTSRSSSSNLDSWFADLGVSPSGSWNVGRNEGGPCAKARCCHASSSSIATSGAFSTQSEGGSARSNSAPSSIPSSSATKLSSLPKNLRGWNLVSSSYRYTKWSCNDSLSMMSITSFSASVPA